MFNDLLLPFVESTLRHAFGNQKALDDQIRFATILNFRNYCNKTNIKGISLGDRIKMFNLAMSKLKSDIIEGFSQIRDKDACDPSDSVMLGLNVYVLGVFLLWIFHQCVVS